VPDGHAGGLRDESSQAAAGSLVVNDGVVADSTPGLNLVGEQP
jgi:hypothetical protein